MPCSVWADSSLRHAASRKIHLSKRYDASYCSTNNLLSVPINHHIIILRSTGTRVDFQSTNSEPLGLEPRVVQVNLLWIDEKRPTGETRGERSSLQERQQDIQSQSQCY